MQLEAGNSSLWDTDWLGCGPLRQLVDTIDPTDLHLQVCDIWENGAWSLDQVTTSIPLDLKDLILAAPTPSGRTHLDHWIWLGHSSGVFSAASGDCPRSRVVWKSIFSGMESDFFSLKIRPWMEKYSRCSCNITFLVILWWLWRWRNNLLLDEDKWDIKKVYRSIDSMARELHLLPSCQDSLGDPSFTSRVFWTPPPQSVVKINTYGSFNVHNRSSGLGVVIRSDMGYWLLGVSDFAFAHDCTHYELLAIKLGLSCAWEKGFRHVI
ncbi:Reverse transcriptase-like [Sesbania bispinosa]|nr:Reverse transcriptase-like [Sesbania bispinosa]